MGRQVVPDGGRYNRHRLVLILLGGKHRHHKSHHQPGRQSQTADNGQRTEKAPHAVTAGAAVLVHALHPQRVFIFVLIGIGWQIGAGIVKPIINGLVLAGALDVDQPAGIAIAVYLVLRVAAVGNPVFFRINLPGVWLYLGFLVHQLRRYRAQAGIRVVVGGKKGAAVAGGAHGTAGRGQSPLGGLLAQSTLAFLAGQLAFFQLRHFHGQRIPGVHGGFHLAAFIDPDIGFGFGFIVQLYLPGGHAVRAIGVVGQFLPAIHAVGKAGLVPFAAIGTLHALLLW